MQIRGTNYMSKKIPLTNYPELLKEWNYEKNDKNGVFPQNVASHAKDKVWWICKEGHEWETDPGHRVRLGSNCPYCAGRYVIPGVNDFPSKFPELLKEWNYEKNGDVLPETVSYGSDKKYWWKCILGHEWQEAPAVRTTGGCGCPYCVGKRVLVGFNDLATKNIQLAQEWDYEENKDLKPTGFTSQSNKKVGWKCSVCGYKWKAKINNRSNGRGCPCCARKIAVPGVNTLDVTHPQIAAEWDYEKNAPLTPRDILAGAGDKYFWLCPEGHSYKATPNHRTQENGTNCPKCNAGRQTSFAEQAVFYYVSKVFPNAINRYKGIFNNSMELDIYIPSMQLAIEYDGEAWHKKEKREREARKYEICKQHGIRLLRIMEKATDDAFLIADETLSMPEHIYEHKYLAQIIRHLLDRIDPASNMWTRKDIGKVHSPVDINIARDELEIREYMTSLRKGSLADLFPEVAAEWHPTLNGNITPYMVKPGSDYKATWLCKDCGEVYSANVGHRTGKKPTGCPKCGIEKATAPKRKAVNMLDLQTGEVVQTFISISEASRQMHISSGNITAVCKHNGRDQAGGYGWEYVTDS